MINPSTNTDQAVADDCVELIAFVSTLTYLMTGLLGKAETIDS